MQTVMVIAGGPVFTILNSSNNNVGSGTLNAGTYQIVPSGVNFLDAIPNYTVQYENGTLEVPALLPAPEVTVVNNCDGTSTLGTNSAGSLLWSTGETTASITVQTAGTYSVAATIDGCGSESGEGIAAPKQRLQFRLFL